MGLIGKVRYKVGYVWGWRLRHWWLDTREGRVAQVSCAILALLAMVGGVVVAAIRAATTPAGAPHQAIIGIIIVLIVALIAGILIAANQPKPKEPPPVKADAPTQQDGQSVKHHFGTCRVKDWAILAWKVTGKDPIQTDGGKKG